MSDNEEVLGAAKRLGANLIDKPGLPEPPEPPPARDGEILHDAPVIGHKRWSVAELLDTEFPEPKWAIPGIFCEGLSIIGGRPKVGKSWLMLQAAWSVGVGGRFFDQKVERGNVLYLALEDSPRRLKDRIKAMGIGHEANITFVNRWAPLQDKGLSDLVAEFEVIDYRMAIIDTLTRAIPGIDQRKNGAAVGRVFDELQRLALNRSMCLVMVDHTRKPSSFAADPIDDIMHTSEKTAISDAILALYKQQGASILLGRGRDMEDVEYTIKFDPFTHAWQVETPELTENFDDILDTLEVLGKCQLGEIVKTTGQNRGSVYKRLRRLVELDMVTRDSIGRNVFYERVESE
jgi:hypothetical protein